MGTKFTSFNIKLLFLFAVLMVPLALSATNDRIYLCRQITRGDGLINDKVSAIARDAEGTYWVGTTVGLNRIVEGGVTQPYGAKELNNKLINIIFKDSIDQIWVVAQEKLYCYDDRAERFNPILYNQNHIGIGSYALFDDGILFGNVAGIYKYSYEERDIEMLNIEPLSEIRIRSIARINDRSIAIMSQSWDLYTYNLDSGELRELTGIDLEGYTIINNILVDSHGRLWIAVYGRGILCFSLDGDGGLLRHINAPDIDDALNIILHVEERNGELWVATDGGGINIINLDDYSVEPFADRIDQKIASQIKSSNTVFVDDNDKIWIGTVRNGVVNVRDTYLKGFNSRDYHEWWDGLPSSTVICMDEDGNGDIWLGVDDGGLACYYTKSMSLKYIKSTAGLKVTDVINIDRDYLLMSVYNRGVFRVNKRTGEFSPVVIVDRQVEDKVRDYAMLISFVKLDYNRILIIADQAYIYDIALGRIVHSNNEPLNALGGFSIAQRSSDEIILYSYNQVYSLDYKTMEISKLYHADGMTINAIRKRGDELWLVMNSSLYTYNIKSGEISMVENPLNGGISTINVDLRGHAWLTSYDKLLCIKHLSSPEQRQFLLLDSADGYMPNEYKPRSSQLTRGGDLYIGGNDGFIFINSDITLQSSSSHEISLLAAVLDGQPIELSGEAAKSHSIDVPWRYSTLDIEVCVKRDNVLRTNSFRYVITGSDKQSVITSRNRLSLSTLTSGTYSVEASYLMINGEWSDSTPIIDITVSTPWWRSATWYFVISIIIIAALIWLLNRYYRHKKQLLLRMHRERKSELERDKVKFLINVSHELRTPLTLIHAPLRRIIDREGLDADLRGELSSIFVQSRYMGKLINMVLNLRKMESGYDELDVKSYDLNSWVEQIAEEFRVELSVKGIDLCYDLDSRVSTLNFDADKCKSVLSNLLMNAYKYSNRDTQITVRTQLKDGAVRVSVVDQGVGLFNIDIDRLFDIFVQQHDKNAGTGIGLSYSKMLIELHEGTIGASVNGDCGSTFYYEIPLGLECAKTQCESNEYLNTIMDDRNAVAAKSLDYKLDEHTILVVEDEKELREFVRDTLKEYFKKVYTASDGAEALALVRSVSPDIVLSDVMMPNMDGFELCAAIKSDVNISHIPVILVTSKVESSNRTMGYKLGADGYIPKPFEIDEVVDIVRNQLYSRNIIKCRYAKVAVVPSEPVVTFSNADEQFFLKLNSFIKENIANPELNIQMMTQHMCMSRATFYKKLSAVIEIGAMEYVAKLRVALAAELLTTTSSSIASIATSVGYNDHQYFSRIFKSYYNCTPSNYRKKSGELD